VPFAEFFDGRRRAGLFLDFQHAIQLVRADGEVFRRVVDELDGVDGFGVDLALRIVLQPFASFAGEPGSPLP